MDDQSLCRELVTYYKHHGMYVINHKTSRFTVTHTIGRKAQPRSDPGMSQGKRRSEGWGGRVRHKASQERVVELIQTIIQRVSEEGKGGIVVTPHNILNH